MSVADLFEDVWGHVVGVIVESAVIVPLDPFGGGDLARVHVPPWFPSADNLGLV